ncbi:epimerase (plasmid) [Devosia sp. A8/3-2]|nr:epimerase [Devosia sp. A8/3-2]
MLRALGRRSRGSDWLEGDALKRDDVAEASDGVSLIVHAVNPPNYQNWDKVVLPMIDNTIEAAEISGARILLPGTIYNFDPSTAPLISAGSPQRPRSRKGAIRVALEQRLRVAAPQVQSIVLRAGDFFGPGARSSWFSQAMVAPGKPVSRVVRMSRGDGHSWAYLPDLAEAAARLMDVQHTLLPFEDIQFEGYYDASGSGMVDTVLSLVPTKPTTSTFPGG